MEKKYQLSIGMIVKNEEKYLERCLKALLPLKEEISCEIIVTDTGSTDKTVEIAQKYADTVLNFTWCDDFAAARNTGVEAATGEWFMFVDADEIFDDSIMEIAKFIKSEDRDSYDNANYLMRNYKEVGVVKNEFRPNRLFNFTKKKRQFVNKIHETILFTSPTKVLDCVAEHYGYITEVLSKKHERNKILLIKELALQPNNIRTAKHLFDVSNREEKIQIAEKYFNLVEKSMKDTYKNLMGIDYMLIIYVSLAHMYVQNGDYDLAINTCDIYFESKLRKLAKEENNLPALDMHFIRAFALFSNKRYKEAIEEFGLYQDMHKVLKEKPDNHFATKSAFYFDSDVEYAKTESFLIECYVNTRNEETAISIFEKTDFYKLGSKNGALISAYVLKAINFDKVELFNKCDNYFKENHKSEYSSQAFLLIGKLYFSQDINDFFEEFSIEALNNVLSLAFANISECKDIFYKKLSSDLEVNSLHEVKIYLQIAYYYLISQIRDIKNGNINLELKIKIENIFVFYIESMIYYLNEVYQPVMFQKQNLDLLSKEESMCSILSHSFNNRFENKVEYIKALKDALAYNEQFKYIVLNSIEIIENNSIEIIENNSSEVIENNSSSISALESKEFDQLAAKIKQSISVLIVKKQFDQAKEVLEQYKSVNPTDPDIEKFNRLMI